MKKHKRMAERKEQLKGLPTEHDFDPYGGCLDAMSAWRNFGGLSIEQAHAKYIDNPIHYQEYFMFMGGKAFVYYFPVLDRYLREFRAGDGPGESDNSEAAYIGSSISFQFSWPTSHELLPIIPAIADLCEYVLNNLSFLAIDPDEQARIDSQWQLLQTQLPTTTP